MQVDKHSRELRCEFLKYGVFILAWWCLLAYQVVRIAGYPSSSDGTMRLIVFLCMSLLLLVAVVGFELYRQSISYIRWYQGILESLPLPMVVTDQEATWRYANQPARKAVGIEQDQGIEELHSRHLIDANGGVMKKVWVNGATAYQTSGGALCVDGEGVGHIILFCDSAERIDYSGVQAGVSDEMGRLLEKMSAATKSFDGCATCLAECTLRQAEIICELTDVIAGIATGAFHDPDLLFERMRLVKEHMQWQVETSQQQIDQMRKTVLDMAITYELINGAMRNMDSVPKPYCL